MYRKKVKSTRKNRASFANTANREHPKNYSTGVSRGGIRL